MSAPGLELHQALTAAGYVPGDVLEACALSKGRAHKSSTIAARRFAVDGRTPNRLAEWLAEREREQGLAGELEKGGAYFGTNPLTSDKGGRAGASDVRAVRLLLIDADPDDGSPGARAAAAELAAQVRDLLERRLGVRPALIDSGRGRQVWLRHEAVPHDPDVQRVRHGLLKALGARFKRHGAHVDLAVHNPERLMRLPGTLNLRTGDRASVLDPGDGREVSLAVLAQLVEELNAPPEPERLPPFPAEVFPPLIAETFAAFAKAVEAPFELAALPSMAAVAAALGPNWVCGTRGFLRTPVLWFSAVAPSGSCKSPAARPGLDPLKRIDVRLREEYEHARAEYDADQERRKSRKGPRDSANDDGPVAPVRRRMFVTDSTPEAILIELQRSAGHGLLVHADELGALISNFDGYRASGSWGRKVWLSLWSCEVVRSSRKQAECAEVDDPFVAVYGTVQPSVLRSMDLRDGDGLTARFLWAHVASEPHGLGHGVSELHRERWRVAIDMAVGHGALEPQVFDVEGQELLDAKLREWTERAPELEEAGSGLAAALYGKAAEYLVRLAALLHGLDAIEAALVEGSPSIRPRPVPSSTVRRALVLVHYFVEHGLHAARLASCRNPEEDEAKATDADAELADLLRGIVGGGSVEASPAEWCRRLSEAGHEITPRKLGRAFTRLSVAALPGVKVVRLPRGEARGWRVSRGGAL